MKQKGLGRGLDAIFGNDHLDAKLKPMTEMAEIAVSEIIPNPTQPRTQFDEEALDELADSIRTLGVIQPITVKRQGDGKYIIISGERRWRAAQRADVATLPAYIREVDDENLHAMALVENIQRQDLNAIEIALGMQRLIDECGLTQDALCIKKDLSVRQIEELVRSFNAQRPAEPAEDEEYPESYLRLVEQLERFFSQEISIKRSKNGGGKIVIDFAGDADIEKFLTRFADK